MDKYSTWEWNYGGSPSFNYNNYRRFPVGAVEVRLEIKNGIIEGCKIYGDFFGTQDIRSLEHKLIGLKYDQETLTSQLEYINIREYFGDIKLEDFIALLTE